MLYSTYRPNLPLSEFVEIFWLYEGYTQPHVKERIMPDGSMQVIVNLLDDELKMYDPRHPECYERFSGALFAGPRSGFAVIDTAAQASLVGIHFKPGGASRFLKMPLSELQDVNVSLDALWGMDGRDVRNRILEATTPEAKLRVFEECLLEQVAKPLRRHPAVQGALRFISAQVSNLSISGLADDIGISQRHFINVFREEIGLTPKLFCRIHRFQRVLHVVHGKAEVDWADVALSCGYFDQAHFNHDFRTFTGINPSTYLKHRTEHLNHVLLVD
jgi:methylphosphotriester-DNA--protein-cysteine methyltransferase